MLSESTPRRFGFVARAGMGVRGKGSAFETPCPGQYGRGSGVSRAFLDRKISVDVDMD